MIKFTIIYPNIVAFRWLIRAQGFALESFNHMEMYALLVRSYKFQPFLRRLLPLLTFEQGVNFIGPYLLSPGFSVYAVASEGSHQVKGTEDICLNYFLDHEAWNPEPNLYWRN